MLNIRFSVETFAMEISPGLFTTSQEPEAEYLAPLWSAHVHSEGQLYFFREGTLRVVTEVYITSRPSKPFAVGLHVFNMFLRI
ncbi:hypothetical protein DFH08DRAFT_127420 [Mycena albidolilacea]|uniref:Uncharacterized protein n=1 Tax=Mycena albidolilacea TaxID=1033008 RepID=A0AAD7E794_9AGAR|nr:hypothetical protein DFH08DRAFT_127420 [Mycena albidolilacea]